MTTVTPGTLDAVMAFDHVIEVRADGSVIDRPDMYAPDLYAVSDRHGNHTGDTDTGLRMDAHRQGWTLLGGWTGQYGYCGPCMHPSEYIGGRLAEHILSTPGIWVATAITEDDGSADMWTLAYRPTTSLTVQKGH